MVLIAFDIFLNLVQFLQFPLPILHLLLLLLQAPLNLVHHCPSTNKPHLLAILPFYYFIVNQLFFCC